ncbi:hypothetical protein ACJIZ3_014591 [Penstemon smallii]|uniref:Uncharacterized protein n=1 Tax=Penstemon smallii TaxID=265156 RepID=A0ABD3RKA2_9LAMI
MEKNTLLVRKGAWTKQEDDLLMQCIDKYGEGKWNLVPFRAGLNRCRRSCRLRWLNNLRPDIKRGSFTRDEVDLIMRLHRLLGNKWSLIAGRLPGRTANNVKNFWNTHMEKKKLARIVGEREMEVNIHKTITQVIRPRPRTLHVNWEKTYKFPNALITSNENSNNNKNQSSSNDVVASSSKEEVDEYIKWCNNLLETNENDQELGIVQFPKDQDHITGEMSSTMLDFDNYNTQSVDPCNFLLDDIDIWKFLNFHDQSITHNLN